MTSLRSHLDNQQRGNSIRILLGDVMKRTLFNSILSLFLFTCLAVTQAHAAGYAILEQSGEGVGVGFAGASAGYGDGSSVYFNPAAMSALNCTQITAGGHLIIPSSEFTNQGSTISPLLGGSPLLGDNGPDGGTTAFVPNFYFVAPVGQRWNLGFGVNSPFGLKTEYDRTWVGRYQAVESELVTINLNPAVSYRLSDNFSIGVAGKAMYADATLSNMIDFGTVGVSTLGLPTASGLGLLPQAADGFGEVEGDDWGYGYTIGGMYQYGKDNRNRIGLNYHSKIDIGLTGNATFTVPTAALPLTSMGAFTNTGAKADVTLPDSASLGLFHWVSDSVALLAEAQWTHWSRFQTLDIKYSSVQPNTTVDEGWDNTWRFSVGTKVKATDDLELSAGFTYDEEPISDAMHRTPRIPGNDRYWLALGASYDLTEALRASLAYVHIFVDDSNSLVTGSTGDVFVGEWDASVDIVSLQLLYRFGVPA